MFMITTPVVTESESWVPCTFRSRAPSQPRWAWLLNMPGMMNLPVRVHHHGPFRGSDIGRWANRGDLVALDQQAVRRLGVGASAIEEQSVLEQDRSHVSSK